jgi:adenosylhomocysteinase
MYLLESRQLRVCGKYTRQERNMKAFQEARFIVLQHILPTTEELLILLREAGAEIFSVIAKPYSIDQSVLARLRDGGFNIIEKAYQELETTNFLLQHMRDAAAESEKDKKKIVILEVGSYFAEPLTRLSKKHLKYFAGVVEDTTFGHNRYVRFINKMPITVFSVARSELKEVEARFVGRDAVTSVEQVLRSQGVSIFGRKALVVGYGMIGKNVAHRLKGHHLEVSVYDKRDYRNLRAFSAGFHVHKKLELLKNADIIFSATGDEAGAVSVSDIEMCKSGVVLASVGSKDTEFDVEGLRQLAVKQEQIGDYLVRYTLPSSRTVVVVKGGAAVNFILKSMPAETIDLVFSEIMLCSILLLKRPERYDNGQIHVAPDTFLSSISKEWLKYINH